MISVASTELTFNSRGGRTRVDLIGSPDYARFRGDGVRVDAEITLIGQPHESIAGWQIGFIQLQYVQTSWFQYRGVHDSDGSILRARDRSTAWPSQLTRDQDVDKAPPPSGTPWTAADTSTPHNYQGQIRTVPNLTIFGTGDKLDEFGTKIVLICHEDFPRSDVPKRFDNTAFSPPRKNLLYSAQIGYAFCVAVVAKPPAPARPMFLKHFYWNCRWRVHFTHLYGVDIALREQKDMLVSVQHPIHTGLPQDTRFARRFFDMTLPIANKQASHHPVIKQSKKWENWHVGHPSKL